MLPTVIKDSNCRYAVNSCIQDYNIYVLIIYILYLFIYIYIYEKSGPHGQVLNKDLKFVWHLVVDS